MGETKSYKFLRHAPLNGSNMRMPEKKWGKLYIDPLLCGLLLLLALFGLVMLYSSTDRDIGLVVKQSISFCLAFGLLIALAQVPPKIYQELSPWLYAFGLFALLMVMVVGDVRLGARRWLKIPGLGSVQPSEFLKLCLPMMMAWYLSARASPPKIAHVLIALMITLVPVLLIAKQPDLGTALLVLASGIFILFFSGLQWWMIATFAGAITAFVPIAWFWLLHDYQRQRVITLLDPEADALGTGWNIIQSKAAIGSGGVLGKGYLQGTQSHLHFLPEGHTDFAIAAISEELGLVGVFILLLLYTAIILRVIVIASHISNTYQRLMVASLGMSFFLYVFINMGMVSGILPVVGVPLPFMSYGGTAIITLMTGFGIIMSIQTRQIQR